MDITNFINSKDIREYHREIGYQYNALEAAWLVYQCDSITLEEELSKTVPSSTQKKAFAKRVSRL